MKRKILNIAFALVFWVAPTTGHTQTISLGIGGGLTNVTGSSFYKSPLFASFDYEYQQRLTLIKLSGLDLDTGYHVALRSLLQFNNAPFDVYGNISYNSFIGKGKMVIFTPKMNPIGPNPLDVESNFDIINLDVGIKRNLLTKPISPFLSGGIVIFYLGKAKIKSIPNDAHEITVLKEKIDFGISIGSGINYKLSSNVLIGISSRYMISNLLGKDDLQEKINLLTTALFIYYRL